MKPTGCHRLAVSFVMAGIIVMTTAATVGHAQQELTEVQEQEIMSLVNIVRAALQGQITATDEPFGWANDFLKSGDQTTFVPFTLLLDPSTVSTSTVAAYIFVKPQSVAAAEPAADAAEQELPESVFEDAFHVDLGEQTADGVYAIRRGFYAPGGDYDVYIALSDSGVPDGTEATTMMLQKAVSVPNLWSDELATSTVIQAASIDQLTAPPPPDQLLANPYTLGNMRIVPKSDHEYLGSDELSLLFLVYNAGVTASGLPDVNIAYTFNRRGPDGTEFFNRTNPQVFNEQTLPPGFDLALGHQLVAGQAIPLSGFPEADYLLEINITDNTNGAEILLEVDFSVMAS